MPLNIALIEPEIAANTGNIARTCACIGACLHIVEPCGFLFTDRNMKRAGCDYWDKLKIKRWSCVQDFFDSLINKGLPFHLFTGHAKKLYTEVVYQNNDYLIFGKESSGIDTQILAQYSEACLRIPMRDNLRSLNLSNAVAIGAYEALRQLYFFALN